MSCPVFYGNTGAVAPLDGKRPAPQEGGGWSCPGWRSVRTHRGRSREEWGVNYVHFFIAEVLLLLFPKWGICPLTAFLHLLRLCSSFKAEFKSWFLWKVSAFPLLGRVTSLVFPQHSVSSSMVFLSALFYHLSFISPNQTRITLGIRTIS